MEEEEGMLEMKMRTGVSLVLIGVFEFSRVIANFILFYVYFVTMLVFLDFLTWGCWLTYSGDILMQ